MPTVGEASDPAALAYRAPRENLPTPAGCRHGTLDSRALAVVVPQPLSAVGSGAWAEAPALRGARRWSNYWVRQSRRLLKELARGGSLT